MCIRDSCCFTSQKQIKEGGLVLRMTNFNNDVQSYLELKCSSIHQAFAHVAYMILLAAMPTKSLLEAYTTRCFTSQKQIKEGGLVRRTKNFNNGVLTKLS